MQHIKLLTKLIIMFQVPMNLFIMYMAGNSISIFPIMMVGMLIVRPVKALFTMQNGKHFFLLYFIELESNHTTLIYI
jgi:hypothetical protein